MKVQIGSKYTGPSFDRPCLRSLPRGWILEETKVPLWKWALMFVVRLMRG